MMRTGLRMSRAALRCGVVTPVPSFARHETLQRRCFQNSAVLLGRRDNVPSNRDTSVYQTEQQGQGQVMQEKQSEYDALTPHARKYLTRVYGNTAAGMFTAGAGTSLMLFTPLGATIPIWACGLASFIPLGALMMGAAKTQPARIALYHSFAGLMGMGAAGAVGLATVSGVLLPAVGLTGATFAGFSAAALLAPKGSAMKMQGPLMAGMFGLIGMQLFSFFVAPTPMMHQMMMYGGLAIFSLFIASDTSNMIEKANQGAEDITGDSINMLINIMQTFSYIVRILTGGGSSD